jgi:hypothetical protein
MEIIRRIKASDACSRILVVSTFASNDSTALTLLPRYRATSYPEAAAESGVQYWDMSGWFGAWTSSKMMDDYHC